MFASSIRYDDEIKLEMIFLAMNRGKGGIKLQLICLSLGKYVLLFYILISVALKHIA